MKELRQVLHYPPDVQACMFWLRTRRRKHWLERAQPPVESGFALAELEEASDRARRFDDQ
jgi:hypothetical protein